MGINDYTKAELYENVIDLEDAVTELQEQLDALRCGARSCRCQHDEADHDVEGRCWLAGCECEHYLSVLYQEGGQ